MIKAHTVIVLLGLSDQYWFIEQIVKKLYHPNISFYVSRSAQWTNRQEKTVKPKLQRLSKEIDTFAKKGKVSLVGISASGSLVGLAYIAKKDKLAKVVNICGRLRSGGRIFPFPPLWLTGLARPGFKNSVVTFESKEKILTKQDRKKFLIFQSTIDELVPAETSYLEGATIITLSSLGHWFGIRDALNSHELINFLSS